MQLSFGSNTSKNNIQRNNTKSSKTALDLQNYILDKEYLQNEWLMNLGEKITLIYLLEKIKPEVSIEIGTFYCGSLKPISNFSKKVYTFDLYTHDKINKSNYANVEFVSGDSRETVPKIIEKLNRSKQSLEFVLIDGYHSRDVVKNDIDNILKYKPKKPLYILMHDSFNPTCRSGILDASWDKCPYVHYVDIDFIHGTIFENESQMWEGLALALLLPEKRSSALTILKSQEFLFKSSTEFVGHNYSSR